MDLQANACVRERSTAFTFFLSIEDFTNYQSLTDHIDNQEVEEWHSSQ
jgi:hypothetical protein